MSDRAFPIVTVRDILAARSIGIGAGQEDQRDRYGYWVYVDDVDTALATLTAAGAPVVEEPADQPWGERVAQTRDPDGNLVYLGARL